MGTLKKNKLIWKKMSHIPCIKCRWQSRQTDTDGPLFIPFIPFPALFVVCANCFVMLCTFLLLLLLYTSLRIQSLPPFSSHFPQGPIPCPPPLWTADEATVRILVLLPNRWEFAFSGPRQCNLGLQTL